MTDGGTGCARAIRGKQSTHAASSVALTRGLRIPLRNDYLPNSIHDIWRHTATAGKSGFSFWWARQGL
jgi:hypothetical protein